MLNNNVCRLLDVSFKDTARLKASISYHLAKYFIFLMSNWSRYRVKAWVSLYKGFIRCDLGFHSLVHESFTNAT